MHMSVSPQQRLTDYRKDEKNGTDEVSLCIALHLYGRHYDDLPPSLKVRVEGAALRAIRAPQAAWMFRALFQAHTNLDRAMAQEMGPVFSMLAPEARKALARIGVQAVTTALIAVLEVGDPFQGAGDALTVYDAADAAQREIR